MEFETVNIPVLYGKEAARFQRMAREAEKRRHTVDIGMSREEFEAILKRSKWGTPEWGK